MPRLSIWMVRTALIYLGTGFTFGGLMLFNKGITIDASIWRLLPLHIEFALIGWTMQLVMGVAFWILPRWRHAPRYGNTMLAWIAYGLFNVGLLSAAAGAWFDGAGLSLFGRGVELLAVILFVAYIWPRVKPLAAA